jgi:hypothetical protein
MSDENIGVVAAMCDIKFKPIGKEGGVYSLVCQK